MEPLSASALYAGVVHYAKLGPEDHLTGTRPEFATLRWMRNELKAAGTQTGVDGFSLYGFTPRRVVLSVGGHNVAAIAPYFYSGVTGSSPRHAPLVWGGNGTPAELSRVNLKGKIVVVRLTYAGENSIAPTLAGAFSASKAGGAVGFVGVSQGPADYPINEDSNSVAGLQGLPGVFVGERSGAAVIAAAQAGRVGSLLLDARVGRECSANVWGELAGRDPARYVVVATPTSALTQAAAERGSGDAILVALARHYAAIPQSERPVTLIFVALSGHELGVGIPTFAQMHPGWFGAGTDAYIGLGASIGAAQIYRLPNGTVQRYPYGDLSRFLYISENPLLQAGAQAAFAPAGPLASVPPGGFDPGEQALPYYLGIPIVAVSGAHYYFHTDGDTPAVVNSSVLAAMAQGFAGSIDYISSLPAGALRAANGVADAFAAEEHAKGKDPFAGDPAYLPAAEPSCAQLIGARVKPTAARTRPWVNHARQHAGPTRHRPS